MAVKMRDMVEDALCGFRGIVIAQVEYLNGCRQALVQPTVVGADGKFPAAEWIDEQRLTGDTPATEGGPAPVPSRSRPR